MNQPDPTSATSRIRAYLLQHYPCQELPSSTQTEVAVKFVVSRELVRQQAAKLGMVSLAKLSHAPVCMSCGKAMPQSRSAEPLCLECRWIEVECSNCGKMVRRSAADMVWRMGKLNQTPRGLVRRKGRAFCDRKCWGQFAGKNYGWGAHRGENAPVETGAPSQHKEE